MTIKRTDLLDVLKQCMPGVESGNVSLEGADTFIFSGGHVYTYNDIMSVRVPIVETGLIEEPIESTVRANEFFNTINKMSGEEIKATCADGKLVLKSGKAKIELNQIEFDFKARLANVDAVDEEWIEVPKDFQMALGLCKMSCNRSSLSGIIFKDDTVVSTDGWQINKCLLPSAKLPLVWISDPAVNEILKLVGLKYLCLKKSWIHFKTENGCVFSVKTLQAEKWPLSKIIGLLDAHKQEEGDITGVFPKELFAAIDRASSFSMDMEDYETVQLTLSKKHISVFAQRTAGKYRENVDWEPDTAPDIDDFVLNVSSMMMSHAAKRSMKFYIHAAEKGGKKTNRLIFTGDFSVHVLSTFQSKEVE